ncbi:hypothetical protein VNO78_11571 [Psophocarpus tetragonolobus]|uniref:RING-type E3 ubiquitin transferase n=1 Tax=Psophocarpus tetragonolobus TaxID=3891 RepID=A0AAN9SPA2_PSOTE
MGLTETEEEHVKPRGRDILRFNITVSLQFLTQHRRVAEALTLFKASIPITCERFENNEENFLRSFLSNPSSIPYFAPEGLDEITRELIPWVKTLFEVETLASDEAEPSDSECREFPLSLYIFVDVPEDEESTVIAEEYSKQHRLNMIKSLKTITDSTFIKTEDCSICMEGFSREESDDALSSMPCHHVFHHQCIVKWLQTADTCPLCRYSMPSAKTSIYTLRM